jgi:restriction system protein
MSIPDFQTFMRPLLESVDDNSEHELKAIKKKLITYFMITEDDLREKIPSQRAFLFDNRLGWANTYLKKAGLISSQRRAYLQITEAGHAFLATHKGEVKVADLKKIGQFREFHKAKGRDETQSTTQEVVEDNSKSPEEVIYAAYEIINNGLLNEILSTIKSCSPLFFEKLVVDLMIKMGYGGSRKEAGTAIGKSGDGGIDGIINEDKLGLDSIYLQAKRWENMVPVKEVRDFAGSLLSKNARKGVFITTSDFPKSAYEFVGSIDRRIVLIDGEKLAELMIENNVGVTSRETFELKDIDNDYFEET